MGKWGKYSIKRFHEEYEGDYVCAISLPEIIRLSKNTLNKAGSEDSIDETGCNEILKELS